jgi:hypothetical protein
MAAVLDLHSVQVDYTNAFCQADQENDVFIELPAHYKVQGREGEDLVLHLQKSLYGQKDAPRLFYNHIKKGLVANGFKQSQRDPCLFIHPDMIAILYVDDKILIGKDKDKINAMIEKLRKDGYQLEEEESPEDMYSFLGINIERQDGKVVMTQKGLIQKFLKHVDMLDCKPKATPANVEPLGTDKHGSPFSESWNYASAVGMLLYLSSNSRPDIQFAVHQCARFTHNPKESHALAIKRIARYLKGTCDKGLILDPDTTKGLDCWVDADFAGLWGHEDDQDPACVKSRTGYVITLFGCPLIWASKLQTEITLSSTAAEYVAFSTAMRELLPLRELMAEIGNALGSEVKAVSEMKSTVFEDNTSCLSLINAPKVSTKNKYLALKYHWFRSKLGLDKKGNGIIAVHVDTKSQIADQFTKGLPSGQFEVLRKKLMGW